LVKPLMQHGSLLPGAGVSGTVADLRRLEAGSALGRCRNSRHRAKK
jgi:hypothetical protein